MNKFLPIAALALSIAALAVALTRGGAAPETAAKEPSAEARVVSLEMEVGRLLRRIDALERSGGGRAGEASPDQSRQISALRSDVDALLATGALDTEEGKQKLREMVKAAQDEANEARAQERAAGREKARAERMKRLAEMARLSPAQSQDITRLLDDEAAKRKALLDSRRGDDEASQLAVRDEVRALRAKTDEAAKALLAPDQVKYYESMRRNDHDRGHERRPH